MADNSLIEIGKRAKEAARKLSMSTSEQRSKALYACAEQLMLCENEILSNNSSDVKNARNGGMSEAFIDRLTLNQSRIKAMADGIHQLAAMPDSIGRVLSSSVRPNGLVIEKISVPLGVIGVIFESRPNVTADAAGICLKSGNAVILRGGKEALLSNIAIGKALKLALKSCGLPEDGVIVIEDASRQSALDMMRLNGYIDILIPRGGKSLIRSVVENASVPVIETGAGTCHTYIDKDADVNMAASILVNAKVSRPSVCNACECVLVHRDIAKKALPLIAGALREKKVEIRGDEEVKKIIPYAKSADESDWGREYNDLIIAAKVVGSIEEAINHISVYGTKHSECIVTDNKEAADEFLSLVDAACVYHNASTRFTDGGEFGLCGEIGISTQKLHARGPLGANELSSYKYIIKGNGQVR